MRSNVQLELARVVELMGRAGSCGAPDGDGKLLSTSTNAQLD